MLSVGKETEYAYSVAKPPLRCVLWERNVGHSIRPGFVDGFLFPYQEALALAAKGDGIDPEEFVAFAPDEHFNVYSCGLELLTHDGAVASLFSRRACARGGSVREFLVPQASRIEDPGRFPLSRDMRYRPSGRPWLAPRCFQNVPM